MTSGSGNPYPDDAPVLVRYPQTKAQEKASRDTWPWLPGSIMSRCGPDEWHVCVEAREVAVMEDGTRPPGNLPDDELLFPCCYRDRAELRPRDDFRRTGSALKVRPSGARGAS